LLSEEESDMARKVQAEVHGEGGLHGIIADVTRLRRGQETRVEVRLDDGRLLVLPAGALIPRDDGGYDLLLGLDELDAVRGGDGRESVVVPVVQERLKVGKRAVETGKVVVRKVVRERFEEVDEPLLSEEVDVRRVAVGRWVDEPPEVRREGDELIVPVVEEVLVVRKRLYLREEVRIAKRRRERRARQRVALRSEEARIERRPATEEGVG
jgi:uncharacterized protein (TIGR02271 family)